MKKRRPSASPAQVQAKRWLGDGPYRVWKNRLRGVRLGGVRAAGDRDEEEWREVEPEPVINYQVEIAYGPSTNPDGTFTAALTSLNPQGRLVEPDEVARTVAWLCVPGTEAITGQSIAIAGGEVM